MNALLSTHRYARLAASTVVTLALVTTAAAQTHSVAPKNGYAPSDDVKLGQEAAAEARKQLPLLRDERLDSYVSTVGQKLAAAIPNEYRHPEFRFTFEI